MSKHKLCGISDLEIENLACNLKIHTEEIRILIVDMAAKMQTSAAAVADAFRACAASTRSLTIELKALDLDPVLYEIKPFGNREPKSYDKFLPKPIGKQRRCLCKNQ